MHSMSRKGGRCPPASPSRPPETTLASFRVGMAVCEFAPIVCVIVWYCVMVLSCLFYVLLVDREIEWAKWRNSLWGQSRVS